MTIYLLFFNIYLLLARIFFVNNHFVLLTKRRRLAAETPVTSSIVSVTPPCYWLHCKSIQYVAHGNATFIQLVKPYISFK